ncbi:hypothetical protein OAV36_03050 [Flavobacteriales bacterium]|jgi:hypothetical protein|nr:hypothetical protein [Flavobacteriales bacterium]
MSKRKKSIIKQEKILKEIKSRTPKIVFTVKNLIVTLRNRNQLDRWLEMYPDGQYVIK